VGRSVLHVDIAVFAIAVERVVDPGLRGRPVVVAPPGSARAPVLVASAEAAREGIRAGMSVSEARRRCPLLIVLPVNEPLYRRAAAAVLALLGNYSPLVEPAAFGQIFLDLTGTARLFGAANDTAARVRKEIDGRLRLRSTAGVATNKLVSRVAARVIRPDGLCDVFPGAEAPFLAPLPVGVLPEARGDARASLEDLAVTRVRDLLALSLPQIRIALGRHGDRLHRQAQGIDESPVRSPETIPEVTEEAILPEDSNEEPVLLQALQRLCERAGARLRRLRATPGRLRVSVRHAGGIEARREIRPAVPTAADLLLFREARALLHLARTRRERVRRLELRCTGLVTSPRQLVLFGPERLDGGPGAGRIGAAETLAEAIDRIRIRFGSGTVVSGRLLGKGAA